MPLQAQNKNAKVFKLNFAKEDDPSISGYSKKTVIRCKYDARM